MMDFDVRQASTLAEAVDTLAEVGDDAKIVAGGQSLLNILKQGLMAPEFLIDVREVPELKGMSLGSTLRIGAAVTHREIELDASLDADFPALREMERHLAYVQVRNWGTLGGNLCIADPTGDPAPVLIAHGAEALMRGKDGERRVALEDFTVDYYQTVLEPAEILVAVEMPLPPPRTGVCYEKFRNVEGDAPIVVAAVRLTLDESGSKCSEARVVLGGVASKPVRAGSAEQALVAGDLSEGAIAEAAGLVLEVLDPIPDLTASVDYKKKLAKTLVKRVALRALERARSAGQGGRTA